MRKKRTRAKNGTKAMLPVIGLGALAVYLYYRSRKKALSGMSAEGDSFVYTPEIPTPKKFSTPAAPTPATTALPVFVQKAPILPLLPTPSPTPQTQALEARLTASQYQKSIAAIPMWAPGVPAQLQAAQGPLLPIPIATVLPVAHEPYGEVVDLPDVTSSQPSTAEQAPYAGQYGVNPQTMATWVRPEPYAGPYGVTPQTMATWVRPEPYAGPYTVTPESIGASIPPPAPKEEYVVQEPAERQIVQAQPLPTEDAIQRSVIGRGIKSSGPDSAGRQTRDEIAQRLLSLLLKDNYGYPEEGQTISGFLQALAESDPRISRYKFMIADILDKADSAAQQAFADGLGKKFSYADVFASSDNLKTLPEASGGLEARLRGYLEQEETKALAGPMAEIETTAGLLDLLAKYPKLSSVVDDGDIATVAGAARNAANAKANEEAASNSDIEKAVKRAVAESAANIASAKAAVQLRGMNIDLGLGPVRLREDTIAALTGMLNRWAPGLISDLMEGKPVLGLSLDAAAKTAAGAIMYDIIDQNLGKTGLMSPEDSKNIARQVSAAGSGTLDVGGLAQTIAAGSMPTSIESVLAPGAKDKLLAMTAGLALSVIVENSLTGKYTPDQYSGMLDSVRKLFGSVDAQTLAASPTLQNVATSALPQVLDIIKSNAKRGNLTIGGAASTLETLAKLFPDSDVFIDLAAVAKKFRSLPDSDKGAQKDFNSLVVGALEHPVTKSMISQAVHGMVAPSAAGQAPATLPGYAALAVPGEKPPTPIPLDSGPLRVGDKPIESKLMSDIQKKQYVTEVVNQTDVTELATGDWAREGGDVVFQSSSGGVYHPERAEQLRDDIAQKAADKYDAIVAQKLATGKVVPLPYGQYAPGGALLGSGAMQFLDATMIKGDIARYKTGWKTWSPDTIWKMLTPRIKALMDLHKQFPEVKLSKVMTDALKEYVKGNLPGFIAVIINAMHQYDQGPGSSVRESDVGLPGQDEAERRIVLAAQTWNAEMTELAKNILPRMAMGMEAKKLLAYGAGWIQQQAELQKAKEEAGMEYQSIQGFGDIAAMEFGGRRSRSSSMIQGMDDIAAMAFGSQGRLGDNGYDEGDSSGHIPAAEPVSFGRAPSAFGPMAFANVLSLQLPAPVTQATTPALSAEDQRIYNLIKPRLHQEVFEAQQTGPTPSRQWQAQRAQQLYDEYLKKNPIQAQTAPVARAVQPVYRQSLPYMTMRPAPQMPGGLPAAEIVDLPNEYTMDGIAALEFGPRRRG